jgi:hypothetical protein
LAGVEVQVIVAGLPCKIGYSGSQWRVTVADVAYANDPDLAAAIVEAFGGLIGRGEAAQIAESIENQDVASPGFA